MVQLNETSQTLLDFAAQRDPDAIEKLLEIYRPFIVVVAFSFSAASAEDLAHDFIETKLLHGNILKKFQLQKGTRFRSWLRVCVRNFCISRMKSNNTPIANVDLERIEEEFDPRADDEEVIFVRSVLMQTWMRVRQECEAENRMHIWELFFEHVLSRLYLGKQAPDLPKDEAKRKKIVNQLTTAKRKTRRLLDVVLQELGFDNWNGAEKENFEKLILQTPKDHSFLNAFASGQFYGDQLDRMFMSTNQQTRDAWLAACEPSDGQRLVWNRLLHTSVDEYLTEKNGCEQTAELSWLFDRNRTVEDVVFCDEGSSIESCRRLKRLAKRRSAGEKSAEGMASFVLYTVVTAKMIVCSGRQESTLNTFQLMHNLKQCLSFDWLDDESQLLIKRAQEMLKKGEE